MCCQYYILPKGVEWDPIRESVEKVPLLLRFEDAGAALITSGTVRPTNVVPVLATDRHGGQSLFPMRWGFRSEGARPINLLNARVETAAKKPTFREAWFRHRCAVPASGYYEWERNVSEDGKRKTGPKYAIQAEDTPIIWLCGLYRIEQGLPVFVILTRTPGENLARIHDRMPLILPEPSIREWIDPSVPPETLLDQAILDLYAEKAS